ncbi:MAG: ABC transporter ATP-binding protein [Lachnoclostridium edouardi]|uniref:ABC transporter ATP-binding protein n=1 Tax=Lachnoclostridium edouardi TaxID=1926283 RepID=UPI0026DD9B5A|nr:ABC transporter ATP-binding protein [Lachnoclostridium edouardi]MDO4278343.1 ABC transporter ATP-binding protein [Lachnoclostridium edouardi]
MRENQAPLLSVKGLSVTLPSTKGGREEVRIGPIDLNVHPGEIVAVIGSSGTGKSTFLKALLQFLPEKSKVQGTVSFCDEEGELELTGLRKKQMEKQVYGKKAVMIFQETDRLLDPSMTVGHQLEEGLICSGQAGKKQAFLAAEALLEQMGMKKEEGFGKRYPHQISGGQRQRAAIALALTGNPKLLICDESTSALDSGTERDIFNMLKTYSREKNMAVLFAVHDLKEAKKADRVIVIEEGRIVEEGKADQVLLSPESSYTKKLLQAAFDMEAGQISLQAEGLQDTEVLLKIRNLKQHFKEKGKLIKAVDGVCLDIKKGEIYGLIGSSGAGKSTLGKTLMLMYPSAQGKIIFEGKEYNFSSKKQEKKEYYKKVAMVFQDTASSLNPSRKVEDLVAQALDIQKLYATKEERRQKVKKALEAVGLSEEIAGCYPHEISGGQRQRVGIARAIVAEPKLIIVDEGVSALDPKLQKQIAMVLGDLREKTGISVLFISHDLPVVSHICDRIGILHQGRLIKEGRW